MKFKMEKDRMLIIPEGQIDEEYLGEVFHLQYNEDRVQAMRINADGSCGFVIEIKKIERKIEIPTLNCMRK